MKEQFEVINLRGSSLALVQKMDQILTSYAGRGYTLTIRQLYYQLVSRNVIPNSLRSYKRVVDIAGKGRMAGLLNWSHIEDRARQEIYPAHWTSPVSGAKSLASQFRINRWINQPNYVMVMLEKDALAGVLAPICKDLDVRLYPNKGYASLSMMYDHGSKMKVQSILHDKALHVLYVGDHDPSGMDMDRDIQERLAMFSGQHFEFTRLALTMDQIQEHNPPPQWAKPTDSRSEGYVSLYGTDVWELDALDPEILGNVVRAAVLELRDQTLYDSLMEVENAMISDLNEYADNYQQQLDDGDLDYYIPDWYKEMAGLTS